MMKKLMMALIVLIWLAGSGWAADEGMNLSPDIEESELSTPPPEQPSPESVAEAPGNSGNAPEEVSHGFGHRILLYIPNRILDVFDVLRLRVRVGPGIALGVRATKPLTLSLGGYTSIFAGLPGPRLKPTVKLPFGIENYAGMEVSVFDGSVGGGFGPGYSNTEIGLSVHPIIIGFDIAVDPIEVVDLALGFLFIDIRGDDF